MNDQYGATGQPTNFVGRARVRIVQLVRAVPDPLAHLVDSRWPNSAVVLVLAALIWNGAKVLGSAWEDVRQVFDKILAMLGNRDQPAAEPDPSLHEPAEPGAVRRTGRCARRCWVR